MARTSTPTATSTPSPRSVHSIGTHDKHDILRKEIREFYLANAPSDPQAVARFLEYIRDCLPSRLEAARLSIERAIGAQASIDAGQVAVLAYREPPARVKPYSYAIPNTNMRVLFHARILPNTPEHAHSPFKWQFYVQGNGQDLDHKPIVELEGPKSGEWHVMTVYVARPGSVLRIDRVHKLPAFPQDPANSMPLEYAADVLP